MVSRVQSWRDCEVRAAPPLNSRMRSCPQVSDLIATTDATGSVFLFDLARHPSSPFNTEAHPQYTLRSHKAVCHALDWSMIRKEYLASGGNDRSVCVWDIMSATTPSNMQPTREFAEQKGNVNVAVSIHF